MNPPVLETCSSYSFHHTLSTHCAHRISTCFSQLGSCARVTAGASPVYQSSFERETEHILRLHSSTFRHEPFSGTSRRKTLHLVKDLMEVLANVRLEGLTYRNPSRNSVPE